MFLCHMLADRLAERDVAKHYTVFFDVGEKQNASESVDDNVRDCGTFIGLH